MKSETHIKHIHNEKECCDHDDTSAHNHKTQQHNHGDHNHDDDHDHDHDHGGGENASLLIGRWPLWLSLTILAVFLFVTYGLKIEINEYAEIALMLSAYLLAGYKTIALAFRRIKRGDLFNEFTLMTIATLGAFYIGQYSEGVAVMIFYEIGELIQDLAVSKSK
ncbi:MAG: hypothetical protein ABIN24_00095, partial [Dyadobacter sp.]